MSNQGLRNLWLEDQVPQKVSLLWWKGKAIIANKKQLMTSGLTSMRRVSA